MSYTKGKWEVKQIEGEDISSIQIKDTELYEPVAQVFHSTTYPYGKAIANAHLIAAAPELLEALKASYHHFSPLLSHGNEFDRAMLAKMYQIISKVEEK